MCAQPVSDRQKDRRHQEAKRAAVVAVAVACDNRGREHASTIS